MSDKEFDYLYNAICESCDVMLEYSTKAVGLSEALSNWDKIIDTAIDVRKNGAPVPDDFTTKIREATSGFFDWIAYSKTHNDAIAKTMATLDTAVELIEENNRSM